MPEKKKPFPHMKVFLMYSFSVILLLTSVLFYIPSLASEIYISYTPFSFDFSNIEYTEGTAENTVPNVEKFPSNYDDIVSKMGDIDQHSKTKLLRYSQTLKSTKDIQSIAEGYRYLNENNIPVSIPQEYINIYFVSEAYRISSLLKISSLPKNIQNAVQGQTKENQILDSCRETTSQECTELVGKLNENFNKNTTLSTLYNWVLFSDYKTSNGYNGYIHSQLKRSVIAADYKNNNISKIDISSEIYWDTDEGQMKKLLYLFEYLKDIYSQSGIENTKAEKDIEENENSINLLIQKDPSSLNTLAGEIIGGSVLNNDTNSNIYFDLKIADKGDGTQNIYVFPVYIYDEDPEYEIDDNNFNEPYDVEPAVQSSGSVRVPIFMYHQIGEVPSGSSFKQGLYVTPDTFEKQMAYLVKMNYKSVTPDELYDLLASGKNPTQKSVMITFDDSVRNQYTNAYPILKKYGLTGVFYVVSSKSSITYTELKEMSDNGMIIGSHTMTHIDLVKEQDDSKIADEIYNSKYALQSATGKTVDSIAYPGCVADSRSFNDTAGAGYKTGVSCGRAIDNRFSNRLSLSRVHVFNDMESFKNLLSGVD